MFFASFLVFLLVFSFLIFIHELGHFLAAKVSNVKVKEFAVGFGKPIFSRKIGETVFSLKWILFGGYCEMLGEEERSNDPRSFEQASLFKRMMITLGGVFFNIIFAIFGLFLLFSIGTNPIFISEEDVFNAEKQGLIELSEPNDAGEQQIIFLEKVKKPIPDAFVLSLTETARISKQIVIKITHLPAEMIRDKAVPKGLAGPVGIVKIVHDILPSGFLAILRLAALISLSLGIMNLLPIPALDGGRFLLQIIELILKPFSIEINKTYENLLHYAGFILLMGLILIITANDIWNLIM